MAGRGSSPPLFELLGRSSPDEPTRSADPAPSHKPKVKIELAPSRPEAPDSVERIRQVGSASVAGGTVKLPISYLYIALAAIALALILVWAIAFKLGGKATERDLVQDVTRPTPIFTSDPLNDPEPRIEPATTNSTPIVEQTLQDRPAAISSRPALSVAVLTATGPANADPREAGLNFLVIESNMARGEAERIVAFLTSNGQPAIGVPMLDQAGQPTNNPPLYTIVLARGFPGRGFNESAATREAMVSEVTRLGTTWQREFKGSTRFSSPQWTKYTP